MLYNNNNNNNENLKINILVTRKLLLILFMLNNLPQSIVQLIPSNFRRYQIKIDFTLKVTLESVSTKANFKFYNFLLICVTIRKKTHLCLTKGFFYQTS